MFQRIESLTGKMIRKALAGSNFSLFLTNRGSVLACGNQQWTGLSEQLSKFYRPQQVVLFSPTILNLPFSALTVNQWSCRVVNIEFELGKHLDVRLLGSCRCFVGCKVKLPCTGRTPPNVTTSTSGTQKQQKTWELKRFDMASKSFQQTRITIHKSFVFLAQKKGFPNHIQWPLRNKLNLVIGSWQLTSVKRRPILRLLLCFFLQIPALENIHVVDIVVGAEHSLALTDDGKVLAWGNNSHGQLGLNQKIHGLFVQQPTVVPDLTPDKCILQVRPLRLVITQLALTLWCG